MNEANTLTVNCYARAETYGPEIGGTARHVPTDAACSGLHGTAECRKSATSADRGVTADVMALRCR
jgi:hypothetical protein